jgi:hypothetical protein
VEQGGDGRPGPAAVPTCVKGCASRARPSIDESNVK